MLHQGKMSCISCSLRVSRGSDLPPGKLLGVLFEAKSGDSVVRCDYCNTHTHFSDE